MPSPRPASICVYLTRDMVEWIRRRAFEARRSQSQYLEDLIERHRREAESATGKQA